MFSLLPTSQTIRECKSFKMRKVVYTVITNDYDKPKEFAKQKGWEYLCFTDNVRNFKSKTWQPVKTIHPQRFIKLTSHRVNAEWSLYIDGSITIQGDLDRLLYKNKDNDFNIVKHRTRSTLNEEAKKCVQLGKADPLKIQNQVNQYYKDGFKPFDNKMVESGIMLRKGTFENKVFGFLW